MRILRVAKITVASLAILLVVVVCAILALRAYRQHVTAEAIAIHGPTGIDERMYVRIGGIDQWIQIRGQDRNNPVLLCLHGGPGGTWSPLTALFVAWEKDFTVVQWDQRGAGKTLESTGASVADTMTIERMARDGIEVAEYLRSRLHKDKVVLLAHSFGSILGVHMARGRPELFSAYVGTGQVASMPAGLQMGYAQILEKARKANDAEAVRKLEASGAPPFATFEKAALYFDVLGKYESDEAALATIGKVVFSAPRFTLWDIVSRNRGFIQIPTWRLYQEIFATELPSLGLDFKMPVYFLQGADDDVTPALLAREYFDKIEAPYKEMVTLPGVGHYAVWIAPEKFSLQLAKVKSRLP
ncbi:MAG: alpha/beta fold hydrolase [Usitatibacter sp.]